MFHDMLKARYVSRIVAVYRYVGRVDDKGHDRFWGGEVPVERDHLISAW
jgi:hypothetical protein